MARRPRLKRSVNGLGTFRGSLRATRKESPTSFDDRAIASSRLEEAEEVPTYGAPHKKIGLGASESGPSRSPASLLAKVGAEQVTGAPMYSPLERVGEEHTYTLTIPKWLKSSSTHSGE